MNHKLSVTAITFLFLFILSTSTIVYSADEKGVIFDITDTFVYQKDIDRGLLKESYRELSFDESIELLKINRQLPITKELSQYGERFENDKGSIQFLDKDRTEIKSSDIAISDKIVSVTNAKNRPAIVTQNVGQPYASFSVIHYDGITSDRELVKRKGTLLHPTVVSDANGFISYYTPSFSTLILAFPDLNVSSGTTSTMYINSFFEDYNPVEVIVEPTSGPQIGPLSICKTDAFCADDFDEITRGLLTVRLERQTVGPNARLRLISATGAVNTSIVTVTAYDDTNPSLYDDDTFIWRVYTSSNPNNLSLITPLLNYTRYINQSLVYQMNDYFRGYNAIGALWYNPLNLTDTRTFVINKDGSPSGFNTSFTNANFSLDLVTSSGDVILTLIGRNNNSHLIEIIGYNSTSQIVQDIRFNVSGSAPAGSPSNLSNGLVAYYDCNTANCLANRVNTSTNLTKTGSPLNGTGLIGSGFLLNGTNTNYYTGTNLNAPLGATPRSMCLWVKPNNLADYRHFVHYGNFSGSGSTYGVYSGATTEANFYGVTVDTRFNTTLSTSSYNQLCINYNGSMLSLYHNGVNTGNSTKTINTQNTVIRFGVSADVTPTYTGNGTLDEVGIWNRTLSNTEILELYNSGSGLEYPFGTEGAVVSPSVKIADIPDLNLTYTQSGLRSFDLYFANYTAVEVNFADPIASVSAQLTLALGELNDTYVTPHVNMILYEALGGIRLSILSNETEFNTTVTVIASSSVGSANDSFDLKVIEDSWEFSPQQISNLNNINMYFNQNTSRDMNAVFQYYDSIIINFVDSIASQSVQLQATEGGATDYYISSHLNISLQPTDDRIILYLQSGSTLFNESFTIIASNDNGDTQEITQVTITAQPVITDPEDEINASPTSAFSGLVGIFGNFYPDETTLTTSEKYAYVLVMILITVVLILLLIGSTAGGQYIGIGIYLALIIAVFEIFYFISIGYIPMFIVVMLTLISVGIAYIMYSKSGAGG